VNRFNGLGIPRTLFVWGERETVKTVAERSIALGAQAKAWGE